MSPWYKSRTWWSAIVGTIAATQAAFEAYSHGASLPVVVFGWLTAIALLLQSGFLRDAAARASEGVTNALVSAQVVAPSDVSAPTTPTATPTAPAPSAGPTTP